MKIGVIQVLITTTKPLNQNRMQKEKQLTTVEWFVMELRKLIKESELSDMRPSEFDTKEMMLIDQAKEMEKQRIKNEREEAYSNGYANGQMNAFTN